MKNLTSTQLTVLITIVIFVVGIIAIMVLAKTPASEFTEVQNKSDWVKGPAEAKVKIVVYSDFQCPGCAYEAPILDEVMKAYPNDVSVAYKHFLIPGHSIAPKAAEATEAAGAQGKFWEMHDLIFNNQSNLTNDSFTAFAQQLGLDVEKFKSELSERRYKPDVDADVKNARDLNVSATPTIYINGSKYETGETLPSLDEFKAKVASLLVSQ